VGLGALRDISFIFVFGMNLMVFDVSWMVELRIL
jgi:hypothetical protein